MLHEPAAPRPPFLLTALVLLVVAATLRLVALGSYPATHPDEGFWAIGSKNEVRFGEPFLDGRLHPYLTPAHFVALCGVFRVVEPSLWSARLFSACAGMGTCLVVAWIGWRCFPRRPWLLLLLFALSSFSTLIQRTALLEAHQLFWMTAAAALWLTGGKRGAALSGLAFGVALLVKSNSLYLLPAFVFSAFAPKRDENETSSPRIDILVFLAAVLLAAGGGYFAAWCTGPERFAAAFRYELRTFYDESSGVLFHVGRFGLNPPLAARVFLAFVISNPLVLPLALWSLVALVRGWRTINRTDALFASWLTFGLLFQFGQTYLDHRYLTTLAPALAYLAARALDGLFVRSTEPGQSRNYRFAALALLGVFLFYHGGRLGLGVARAPDMGYWPTVRWVRDNLPSDARLLAAPYVGLSVPQRAYDFFRTRWPYGHEKESPRPLSEVIKELGITHVIVEGEWRAYQTEEDQELLRRHGPPLAVFGEFEIYRAQ